MSDSPPIFLTKNTIVIRTKHMTTTDKLIATIIRALKVAVIKADSTTLIEQTYNPAIIAANELEAEIIRNHQPEPTQKQVDEKQLLDALEPKQIKIDIAYQGFYAFGAIDALHYLRPYLKQPTPADETLREFACVQVCKDLTRPYSGNPDDKTLDEIIADAKHALAQPSKPAVTPKDLEKVAEAIYTAGARVVNINDMF